MSTTAHGRPGKALGYVEFAEKKCGTCGRMFIPAPQHALRSVENSKFFCSCSCFRSYNREREAKKLIANPYRDPEIIFPPLTIDGKEYRQAGYYLRLFRVSGRELISARNNGLPYIKKGRLYYYNKQDFFDYWSGRIGKDKKDERSKT